MPVIMIKGDARAREKPCLRCGYSLRKVDATHCPECGLSVWLSLNQNDTLDWSNPAWLRGMVAGLWVMVAAQAPAIVAFALMLVQWVPAMRYQQEYERVQREVEMAGDDNAAMAAAIVSLPPQPPPPEPALRRTAILLAAGYLVAYHAGLFLLVRPERRYPDRLATARGFAWATCGAAALVGLGMAGWAVRGAAPGAFEFAFKLVTIASALVTFAYLRRLAKRYPHATLAKACAWLMLLPAVSLFKVFPFCAYVIVRDFGWLLDLLPALYLPACVVLFAWFARLLRRAAVAADEQWRAETAITR